PDELVEMYGADPTRLSILFIGPADEDMEWTPAGVEGIQRFLRRLWRAVAAASELPEGGTTGDGALARKAHRTIARATDDLGRRQQFNTPISSVMELVNELVKAPGDPAARFAAETAVSLIQPYAPHVADEVWERVGHERLWERPRTHDGLVATIGDMRDFPLDRRRALVAGVVVLLVLVVAGKLLLRPARPAVPPPVRVAAPAVDRSAANVFVNVVGAVRRPGLYRL